MTNSIELNLIGSYQTGVFDEGAAEISAYDAESQRLFVINANAATIDILDLSDPTLPVLIAEIDATIYGALANSVAVNNGVVAVAIESETAQDPGVVIFLDADGNLLNTVTVGALPDMVTFTPDGQKLLVANEGEPNDDYTVDPEGSVSIIDLANGVANATVSTAGFTQFNSQIEQLRASGVRIFGPNATVAQDLEPEYIAVSSDSTKAWVSLQEANALGILDIQTGVVTAIVPLGFKDQNVAPNGLDASNDDDAINIANYPVLGMYQPDAIAAFEIDGETYLISANEGDSRDYDGFSEEARIADLTLDATAFPNAAELQQDSVLGRLLVTTANGDADGDGDFEQLYSFGGRSFSIWDADGNLVFDSGSELERITAELLPEYFNSNNNDNDSFDSRSDDKGPEPEGVTVGKIGDRTYAFIGLERIGGVIVYDVTEPTNPSYVQYVNNRDFSVAFDLDEDGDPAPTPEQVIAVGDLAPEGLTFISVTDSPNAQSLLVVANEVSGSTTIYEVTPTAATPFALQLLHASDQEAGAPALEDAPNFSAVLDALKNEDADSDGTLDYANTLVLSSGDAYIPSPFFFAGDTVFGGQGRGDILIQNELGFQAIAFGNHEFDLGTSVVADLIAATDDDEDGTIDYVGAQFPYLSSNLDFSTNSDLAPLVAEDGQEASEIPNSIAGSTVITLNGETFGIVGATTPTLPQISSPGSVTVLPDEFDASNPDDVAALAAEIQASVDELLASNPTINKVILLAHMQQIAIEQQLAGLLTDVDIIVAGGSNTLLADEGDRLRAGDEIEGAYPILSTAADGNPIAVVNTDGNYRYVGRLVVDFDSNGVIIPESIDPAISGAYATDEAGVAAVNGTPDPEIVEITTALQAVVVAQDGNLFGNTSVFLNGARGDVRTQETNLGNLTADANLAIAQQTDPTTVISIKNGGGIRDNIGVSEFPPGSTDPNDVITGPPAANPVAGKEAGDVSQLDIGNALRFNNDLSLVTVTSEELLGVIEHGVAASAAGATPGQFPQVSGLFFSYDVELPAGDRVQSLAVVDGDGNILDVVVQAGELVGDSSRTFRLVTLGFLADGGDGYPFPDRDRVDLAVEDAPRTGVATFADDGTEQDALAEYLATTFADTPFAEADVSPAEDTRIQNLDFREDTVLDGFTGTNVAIYAIQGEGHASPLVGESVATSGIVTAVDTNGFYLQDPAGDGNDATSDGIFVFTGSAPGVAVGDEVEVSGTVSEFTPGGAATRNLSTTQISGEVDVEVVSSGNQLPAAVILGANGRTPPTQLISDDQFTNAAGSPFEPETEGLDFYESLEGMRVTVEDAIAVSPTNRFGEIVTLANRGENATGLSDRGTINISPDDFNPERIQIQYDRGILPDFDLPQVDVGAQLGDVTGVVGYSFGNFEVNFTAAFVPTASTLEPEISELSGTDDQLTIATYNVLNLDPNVEDVALVDDNDPGEIDDDLGDGRFDAIAAHIATNLNTPDILALQEVQDNNGAEITDVIAADETLQLLIDKIAELSGIDYAFIDNPFIGNETSGGQPGGNIRNAFLYNPERVSLVEGSVSTLIDPTDQQTNPDNPFYETRPPLVATFEFEGEAITLVNNHFSSKGGSAPLFGQVQPSVDLQNDPTVNGGVDQRLAQAQVVKAFVDDRLADDRNAKVVVLGDLNEFEFISPLETLEQSLVNLTETLPANERYSFIFEGNSQSLDHILVSGALAANAELDAVRVNTEFADQASDHDPLLVSLSLDDANVLSGTADADELVGTAADETFFALGGNDLVAGELGNDVIYGNADDDVLRGDRNSGSAGGSEGGDDLIYGGAGNDRIGGKGGNDQLWGEEGDDAIWGDNGDDLIYGGAGNDILNGGQGSDIFVIAIGDGTDIIRDFKVGSDSIGLLNELEFSQLSIAQAGNSATISAANEVLAVLRRVQADTLTESSFVPVVLG